MKRSTLDPTAGERAREIWADPVAPQRIADPTDPRYGNLSLDSSEQATEPPRIFDPTDPQCGDVWA